MLSEEIPQLRKLSLVKKQQLIEELIDEVYGGPVEEPQLADALEARLEHFRQNPGSAKSWSEVKARLRGKK